MGQAKQRGTFDQRREDSIRRHAEAMEQRRINLAAREQRQREYDAANPHEAAARKAKSARVNLMLATILGLSAGAHERKAP
jgi:hypothetical protein